MPRVEGAERLHASRASCISLLLQPFVEAEHRIIHLAQPGSMGAAVQPVMIPHASCQRSDHLNLPV
ncbi:hypothetical protein D3C84_712330 [compost metagenome]